MKTAHSPDERFPNARPLTDWYSDKMVGKFSMLTRPYLFDSGAIAYSTLMTNHHSPPDYLPPDKGLPNALPLVQPDAAPMKINANALTQRAILYLEKDQ